MKLKIRSQSNPDAHSLPLIQRLHAFRGEDPHYRGELKDLISPSGMKGLPEAARVIAGHIEKGTHIVILADYDADGATSCAVAVRGLRMFGAKVSFVEPHRQNEGSHAPPWIGCLIHTRMPA